MTQDAQESFQVHRDWSLAKLWRSAVQPDLLQRDRATATIEEYDRAIGRYEAWQLATNAPVQSFTEVNSGTLLEFGRWLSAQETPHRQIDKSIGCLLACIRWAASHDFSVNVPRYRKFQSQKRAARKLIMSLDQLNALYDSADVLNWPRRDADGAPLSYSAATGWRAALVMWVLYGMRTEELVSYTPSANALTWGQIYDATLTPDEDGQAQNASGWFAYTPDKQKRTKPQPLVLPLHAVARKHLEQLFLCKRPPGSQRVFHWPHGRKQFYAAWHTWIKAAGIRPRQSLQSKAADQYAIKHLRKTCVTMYERHRPGLAGFIVGHSGRASGTLVAGQPSTNPLPEVTAKYYLAAEEAIVEAVNSLPLPASFLKLA